MQQRFFQHLHIRKNRLSYVEFYRTDDADQADHEDVAQMLRQLTAESRMEPGCVSYIPHFVEGDACTVLIYEQYANEAALDHHRNAPHCHQYA